MTQNRDSMELMERGEKNLFLAASTDSPHASAAADSVPTASAAAFLSEDEARRLSQEISYRLQRVASAITEAAYALKRFISGRGWIALGYRSLNAWREANIGEREYWNVRNAIRLLDAGVPPEAIARMPITSIQMIVEKTAATHVVGSGNYRGGADNVRARFLQTCGRDMRRRKTASGNKSFQVIRHQFDPSRVCGTAQCLRPNSRVRKHRSRKSRQSAWSFCRPLASTADQGSTE